MTEASLRHAAPEKTAEHGGRTARFIQTYGIYAALLVLVAIGGLTSPAFVSGNNLSNLLLQASPLGIVVIGQAFVILVRGLILVCRFNDGDCSGDRHRLLGAGFRCAGVVAFSLAIAWRYWAFEWAAGHQAELSPFLATLATMILLQGFRFRLHAGCTLWERAPILPCALVDDLQGYPATTS